MTATTSQVRVAVRVRPLTDEEQSLGGKQIIVSDPHSSEVSILSRKFTFDGVYDESVSQSHLYSCVGADGMMDAFLDGYNSTIMAYGQTGSGKTFTMGSEANYHCHSVPDADSEDNENLGLIPRFMNAVFSSLHQRKVRDQENFIMEKEKKDGHCSQNQLIDYQVSTTFLEVYGEGIHDLLGDDSRQVLPLREDGKGGNVVVGLKEQKIHCAKDALQILHDGTLNRTTAATLMNKKSSRSHAVFTIILKQTTREYKIEQKENCRNESGTMDVTTVSRFTFVDLAGSERMKKTGAEGERAKEGIKINQGLLALGNVINALADEERLLKGGSTYVPYRQTKLTRLLQDALGGNSQTLFLACVSPSDTNASETASTLAYANRARNIKNSPSKNVDATVAEMQRLYALTTVLERELVRVKFGDKTNSTSMEKEQEGGCEEIGKASEELLQSTVVQEYLHKIRQVAADTKATAPFAPSNMSPSLPGNHNVSSVKSISSTKTNTSTITSTIASRSTSSQSSSVHPNQSMSAKRRRQSVLDSIDDTILGVNPDEDIALLDKLLELQRIDQEFDMEAKEDQEKLNQVEGELEAQEQLLLQLKDNMKGYYNLKDRFEAMMMEVQNLEVEKSNLAMELESAQVDPSKGCSKAIKKRLDDVESKLARARSETRKNQQTHRRAEQEAQKAKVLHQKIQSLKQGKVALVKKQREAAAKHKESTEARSREIQALKKKERKTGQQMTKLEAEVQKHKVNLDKRKAFCNKLSDKLKKTEAHLIQVLALRKRDAVGRTRKGSSANRKAIGTDHAKDFAPPSEEIDSIRFLLEKLIMDRVSMTVLKASYETKANEYSDLMRSLVEEMKLLKESKEELRKCQDDDDSSDIEQAIKDSKQTIDDLEFRLEFLEGEIEKIRSRIPHIDDDDIEEAPSRFENDAMKMVANLGKSVSRTLLWDILDVATKAEASKVGLHDRLKRKEVALSSFENEIECLNQQIIHLSEDLDRRRSIGSISSESSRNYICEIDGLKERLLAAENENQVLAVAKEKYMVSVETKGLQLSALSERMTVMKVTMKNKGVEAKQKVEETMSQLQEFWLEIGLSRNEREFVRVRIEDCLEISCDDALKQAKESKIHYKDNINSRRQEIEETYLALGMYEEFALLEESWSTDSPLLRQIDTLQRGMSEIAPTYNSAIDRRANIISEVETALASMGKSSSVVCDELASLLELKQSHCRKKRPLFSANSPVLPNNSSKDRRATQFKQVEEMVRALECGQAENEERTNYGLTDSTQQEKAVSEPGMLADDFLSFCEAEMTKLKMEKAKMKVSNQAFREEAKRLTKDMHLRGRELLSLSIHSMKKRMKDMPGWWDHRVAEEVCRSIMSKEAIVKVGTSYTKHLEAIHDCLSSLSKGREMLSKTLQDIVKNAQNTLLQTVESELDAGEAYASFDAALARLPPLSKENVNACIEEMNTLVEAVDTMAQSEVEALTVVWDALSISRSEKGNFWGHVEQATKSIQSQPQHDFEGVLKACTTDIEEWLLCAVKDAQKVHRTLNNSLLKLSKIHEEVERLSTKQGNKSKIMSLDSELCILSAKLAEFEEKANSKQRLTKKTNSSSLLKEEKFRKQMQHNFTIKLKSLSKLVRDWEVIEGENIDRKMLTREVSELLENPDRVERRTEFMHLKTVQQKLNRGTYISASPLRRPTPEDSRLRSASSRRTKYAGAKNVESISSRKIRSVSSRSQPRGSKPTDAKSVESRSTRVGSQQQPIIRNRNRSISPFRPKTDRSKSPAQTYHRSQNVSLATRSTRKNTPNPEFARGRTRSELETSTSNGTKHTSSRPRNGTTTRHTKSPRSKVLKSKQVNHRPTTSTPLGQKMAPIITREGQSDSPILPFGQILNTPTDKENFRF